jgi:hypothetical protein
MWKTKCPRCGRIGSLYVVSFAAETRIPLCADGFSVQDAKHLNTTDEKVLCDVCDEVFTLWDLDTDNKRKAFVKARDLEPGTYIRVRDEKLHVLTVRVLQTEQADALVRVYHVDALGDEKDFFSSPATSFQHMYGFNSKEKK